MSAFDFTSTRAQAARLMSRFGRAAILRRWTIGVNADGSLSASTSQDFPVTAVDIGHDEGERDGRPASLARTIYVLSTAATPALDDSLVIDGEAFGIFETRRIAPDAAGPIWACRVGAKP